MPIPDMLECLATEGLMKEMQMYLGLKKYIKVMHIFGELIVKSDKYSPYYAGNVIKMLSSLGASKKDFYRYYFGNYIQEKDFIKRPLAKLTKDIVTKYLPEILD